MPVTADQIKQRMTDAMGRINNSLDVKKGPIHDLILGPVSDELAPAYAEMARIESLYSQLATGSADTMSQADLTAIGTNARVSPRPGRKATGLVYFYFQRLPAQPIVIPAGTPVATTDSRLVFVTDNTVQGIDSTVAISYWRAANNRYEIPVTVTSVVEGTRYNIPANRVVQITAAVTGIDGVYNPVATQGGSDASDPQTYLQDIRDAFVASDTGSVQGIRAKITKALGTGITLNFVQGDSPWFQRPVAGKGLDVYTVTPNTLYTEELFVAGGSQIFGLRNTPVLGIDSVTVNGAQADFVFRQDTGVLAQSARAQDAVEIPSATNGNIVRVNYRYDQTTRWIQDNVLSEGTDDYFGVDGLARLAPTSGVWGTATMTVASGNQGLLESVRGFLADQINANGFADIDPQELRAQIFAQFPGIRGFRWQGFGATMTTPPALLPGNPTRSWSADPTNFAITLS